MEVEPEGLQLDDYETFIGLSEFYRKEQLLKNLGYEKEKPSNSYDAIEDDNLNSHMKWHLREKNRN